MTCQRRVFYGKVRLLAPPERPGERMNSRNQSLDVLRGIAILLVLGRHFDYFPLLRQAGWIGVDLFFVLSGFLISGLLFQEYKSTGKLNVRRFILRRGLKIWPSYYLLILATMLFYIFIARASEHPFPKHEIAISALFVRNYFGADGFNFLAHTRRLAPLLPEPLRGAASRQRLEVRFLLPRLSLLLTVSVNRRAEQ